MQIEGIDSFHLYTYDWWTPFCVESFLWKKVFYGVLVSLSTDEYHIGSLHAGKLSSVCVWWCCRRPSCGCRRWRSRLCGRVCRKSRSAPSVCSRKERHRCSSSTANSRNSSMRGTTSVPKLRSCRSVHFIQKQQKKQLIEPEVFVPLGKLINEHEWLLFSGLDLKKMFGARWMCFRKKDSNSERTRMCLGSSLEWLAGK